MNGVTSLNEKEKKKTYESNCIRSGITRRVGLIKGREREREKDTEGRGIKHKEYVSVNLGFWFYQSNTWIG